MYEVAWHGPDTAQGEISVKSTETKFRILLNGSVASRKPG